MFYFFKVENKKHLYIIIFLHLILCFIKLSSNRITTETEIKDTNNIIDLEFNKVENETITIPFKKRSNLFKKGNEKSILFNLYFIENKKDNLNFFGDLELKAVISHKKNISDSIFNDSLKIEAFDKSTKSVVLNINKETIVDQTKSFKENEDIYLYLLINNTKNTNDEEENAFKAIYFLTYTNNTNDPIMSNIYISDRLIVNDDEDDEGDHNTKYNYNFYLLNGTEKSTFVVDFTSNYALNRRIYVSFLDNGKKYDPEDDLTTNSSNINFIDKDSDNKMYHFEFTLKNAKEILFCVVSRVERDKEINSQLLEINYIFKYYTYEKNEKISKYELNQETKLDKEKNSIEISNIQILENEKKSFAKKGKIYLRKISNDDKYKKEEFNTIGIIKSPYELIEVENPILEDTEKITVKPKNHTIDDKEFQYSILIYLDDGNKFVYETVYDPNIKRPYITILIIFIIIPILLGIIIFVIVKAYKKNLSLKDEVMAISFKKSGADSDNLIEGKDNNEDKEDNVLK